MRASVSLSALRKIRRSSLLVAAAVAGAALQGAAPCAADTWDNSSGNALWSTASNWADNTVPTLTDPVIFPVGFPGGAHTIGLAATELCAGLAFSDSYILFDASHSHLQLGGSGVISVASGKTASIRVPLTGTAGLNKTSPGTLVLTSSNSFTGTVFVSGGTLLISDDSQLGNAGNGVSISSGTLSATANLDTFRNISVSGVGSSSPLLDTGSNALLFEGGGLTIDQGSANDASAVVAFDVGGSGTALITGTASTWTNSTSLTIGEGGPATVTVQAGGTVTSANTYLGLANGLFANGNGGLTVTGPGSNFSAGANFGIAVDSTGTMLVSNGGLVTSTGVAHIGSNAGSTGSVTVTGSGSLWNNNGGFLGVGYTGSGSLLIQNGGAVTTDSLFVAADLTALGILTIDGAGSNLTTPGAPVIGEDGTGTLVISNGGALNSSTGFIGRQADGIGNATITGTNSTWNCGTNTLTVANGGTATLSIKQGGSVISGDGILSDNTSATATLTVSDINSKWTMTGDLLAGFGGRATVSILAGGVISDKDGTLGFAGVNGSSAVVDGSGSAWNSTSNFAVGENCGASLTVQNGGHISAFESFIGYGVGGTGTALVTGNGSLWTGTDSVIVGYESGIGTLTISNGGIVHSNAGTVAVFAPMGTATVTGTGSAWNLVNALGVGEGTPGSTGALTVSLGGTVHSGYGFLGYGSGATGTVTVSDPGSSWTDDSNLEIADNGATGTLTITNQGAVTINGNITGGSGGGFSTITLDGGTLDVTGHNLGTGGASVNVLNFRSGTLKNVGQINGGTTALTKTTTGTLTLDGNNSYTSATTVSAGTLIFKTSYTKGLQLNIADGALAQLPHSAATPNNVVIRFPLVVTNTSGRLDLVDNKLITSGTVGTWNGTAYTGVSGQIAAGRNGNVLPLWDGAGGIITSQSAATTSNYTAIGIARASTVRPSTVTATASWGGQIITGTDTLVMYTYGGDATLDGKINIDDYIRIDAGIAAGSSGWANGDFNYDGKINIDDYTQFIDANITTQGPPIATSSGGPASAGPFSGSAVPEPATVAGLLMVSLPWLGRRRRF